MHLRICIFSFPTPALSGSGFMRVISACDIKAPLRFRDKDKQTLLQITTRYL
jgi:hypothetical protein